MLFGLVAPRREEVSRLLPGLNMSAPFVTARQVIVEGRR